MQNIHFPIQDYLTGRGLPAGDAYDLPESPLRFPDGAHYRMPQAHIAPRPVKIGAGLRAAVRFRRSDVMAWIADGCPRVGQKKGGAA